MSSQPTYEFYKDDIKKMSPIRAIASTLLYHKNPEFPREILTPERAYKLASQQASVTITDMPIYEVARKRYRLPKNATILNEYTGKVVGRAAQARRFYDRASEEQKKELRDILMDAVYEMQKKPLIQAEAVIGLDPGLMIKAHMIATVEDANNVWNWYHNFTPYEICKKEYDNSDPLPIQDIIFISDPSWRNPDYPKGLALFDPYENVVVNLGMTYFGERKKGTLTLAWSSGMRLGQVACHAGIKEIDFTECEDPKYHPLGKRSISFFGLSGSGKSSYTNSHDHAGTLPAGFKRKILHDDAYQIDIENKLCRVWEPTLFDKTDSREMDHPDWKYCISSQNNAILPIDGELRILGQDIRNKNGRAIFDRDLLGANTYINQCSFPHALCWIMKDETLPPVIKFDDKYLAVAMGATLMTKRTAAENVSIEEMKKLVFEPFANPFRVYELYKDCEGFYKVLEAGAECYCFNSGVFWAGNEKTVDIPLKLSLRLNTAILCNELEWESWTVLPGAMIPAKESITKIAPEYLEKYDATNIKDPEAYKQLFENRFNQRKEYLNNSDLKEKPELLETLLSKLQIKI
ncbi:MAG TPA: phosphoenolpyruvate carboxykinase (ATP) [Planctomycetota bacterium]|nr:phosphoenolpyruvate carboxykinase (ATP) [Planctomycetota bacterium]